jgi:PAS domain S-box-containing protein
MALNQKKKDATVLSASGPGPPWSGVAFVAFVFLLMAILLAVFWAKQERAALKEWSVLLSATADEQKAAIESFLEQKVADAAVFASFPSVVGAVDPELWGTVDADHLESVLEKGRIGWKSRSIALLGSDLSSRARTGEELPAGLNALLSHGDSESRIGLVESSAGLRIVVASPVRSHGAAAPLGWIVVVEDPETVLWKLLSRGVAGSRTRESLLVGRESGAVAFLSPLRHLRGGARPGRTFLKEDALAARHALDGPDTFGEFRDYRGEKVLAAVRRIEATGWGLVVKVDRAEALSGLVKERAWSAFAVLSLGLALGAVLWSVRSAERLRVASELQKRDERHRQVLEQVRDAVIWVEPDSGRILEANRAAEELWGYPRPELLARSIFDLLPEEALEAGRQRLAMVRRGGALFRSRHRRKDGSLFPVEVSSRGVVLEGDEVVVSVVRDVSESEAALERIQFLNRTLRTISAVDQILVEEHDRETLLRRICEEVVASGGFAVAWFGVEGDDSLLVPAAAAGRVEGFFEEAELRSDDSPRGRGPAGVAFREGRTVVVDDWETDPLLEPWREAGRRRGYRSSAACPVRSGERICGVLSVYAAEPSAFVPDVVLLLEELAGDLGLALGLIESDAKRRAAEGALAASEARYRQLFEDNPAPMWVFDVENLRFLAVNDAAVSLYGFAREDFLARTLRDIRPVEDVSALEQDVLVPRDGARRSGPWRHLRKDGSSLLVEILCHDVPFEGRAARLVLASDVTDRMHAEEKTRAFFDSGMAGAILGDVHGNVLEANDEYLRIVGFTREDLETGRLRWSDITPPEWLSSDAKGIAEAKARGVCTPYEKEYIRKDGTRVPVLVGYALVGEAREESVAFILDQTERRKIQEEVRRLNAELEQRVESRTAELVAKTKELEAFAYSVSHDLRAPLRAIDGFSRMIEEEQGERLDEEGRRLVGVVRENARRMARLIDDLLSFSRAGRHELRKARVDVGSLVRSVLGEALTGEETELCDLTIGELPDVQADPALLRQVFVNLLSNAVKFTSTRPRRRIEVSGRREGGRVFYDVSDNGVGFDTRYAGKLFGVFQRLHGREFEGTGVGLALVERIVARHDGTIRAEAEPDRGAKFTISFPDGEKTE